MRVQGKGNARAKYRGQRREKTEKQTKISSSNSPLLALVFEVSCYSSFALRLSFFARGSFDMRMSNCQDGLLYFEFRRPGLY